jgi:hypothetical protein
MGLSNFDATMICEGQFELAGVDIEEMDEAEAEEMVLGAWQQLIDTGLAWQLQGSFGRQAQALIEAGLCEAA